MDKKCNKYEAYFMFANESDYRHHLLECPDCQMEKLKEEKLSILIKDAAPVYRQLTQKRKAKKTLYKAACALFLFVAIGTYVGFEHKEVQNYQNFIKSNGDTSIIAAEGLPVDEYGFFDYN